MKKTRFLFALLMAIVMMVVSPTIMWAVSMGDDEDSPTEEPMPEPEPEPGPETDPDTDPDTGYDPGYEDPGPECDHPNPFAKYNGNGQHVEVCNDCWMELSENQCYDYDNNGRCDYCYSYMNWECAASGTVIASSGAFAGEEAAKLFDGDRNTKWCSNVTDGNAWVIFKPFGSGPNKIKSYRLVDAIDTEEYENRRWDSWTIYGTNGDPNNNETEWAEIYPEYAGDAEDGVFNMNQETAYSYYKIEVVPGNFNGEDIQQMGEMIIEWASVPTFASIDELLAADLASETTVTVTVNGTIAGTMYGSNQGVYQVVLNNGFAIASMGVTSNPGWAAGRTVSGTLENVTFMRVGEGDEEVVGVMSEDRNIFEDLTYAVPTFASIQALLDANLEDGTIVTVTVNGTIASTSYDSGFGAYMVFLDNNVMIGSENVPSDLGWVAGGTVSGTLTNVIFVKDNVTVPGVVSETTNLFAPGAGLEYTAPAGGSESSDVASVTIGETNTGYADIQDALTAAKAAPSATLTLLQNITLPVDKDLEFNTGNVTLDLNGHTIAGTYQSILHVVSGGALTITDNSVAKTGLVQNGYNAVLAEGGSLTIHAGTFECTTENTFALKINSGVNASIDGGRFISKRYAIYTLVPALATGYCYYDTQTDDELEGSTEHPIYNKNGGIATDITVKAASAAPEVPTFASIAELIAANQSYDAVNVTVKGMITMLYPEDGYDGIVLNNEILISAPATGITWKENGTVSGTLTNMRWDNDFRSLVGGSEEVWSSLTYTAPAPVATVTINGMEFQYTSIYQAIGALYETKTSTLKLLADVEYPTFNLEEGQDITIDLNNYKYTTQLYEDEWYSFEVPGDSKLTVKNGTIISNRGAFIVTENSSLNIFNCTVEAKGDGIRVNNEESFVNIVNTNISSKTDIAIYMADGTVNLSGNCRFTPGSGWAPVFVDCNGKGVINLDFGYMMVDSDGTKITSFVENIGTRGQYAEVVADPAAVAECAAGSHSMKYHDAVPGTCTEHGKAEYWHCTTCQRFYADAAGNTILPLGSLDIIPETPFAHHFVDGRCTVCHMVELAEPVMVTESNYASLGLDEKYVGYYAIQNPSNLAFVAELFGGQLEPASEPETGVGGNDGPFCAPRRANKENGNDQQQKARRNAVRKVPGTQENILGFVLTDNIVVNANLLDANGMPNDRDNNGNIRSGLLAWTPMHLYNNADKTIFDGNGHTISGLYQNTPVRYSLGFIKATDEGVTIKNLGITDSYFGSIMEDYGSACGSLIDYSYADIENCWSDATIDVQNADYASIGGLVGYLNAGNISDSYFSGRIMSSGAREVAGLIAEIDCYSDDVTISNCHFSGSMSCKQGNISYCGVAGLINYISADDYNIVIERCYADGEIDAKGSNTIVSGLFNNQYTNGGTAIVRNNYNAMTVNAPSYYGLFYSAQGNGNISFNVNADKNAFSPYSNAYISGDSNISVADEENVYDGGFVFDVTEEQMASGAVAYRLNMLNEMFVPGEEAGTGEGDPVVGPVEREPVVPRAPRRAAEEETEPAVIWYQLIGEEAHPMLAGDEYSIVYCDDEEPTSASVFYNLARTLDSFALVDATEYAFKSKTNVAELTYTRTFGGTNWTTWYVPFDLVLTDEICAKLAFSRINNVHQYDDNEDGNADRTVIESFRQKAGVTLKANYPYLVKALEESAQNFSLTLSNVTLAPAMEYSIDCQSVDYLYTFTGTYTGMGDSGLSSYSLFDNEDSNNWLHFYNLEPQRHYMTITSRNGGNGAGPARVKLVVVGEENVTGIVTLYDNGKQMQSETYDLSGRRIVSDSQQGLRIVNGKVIFIK